MSDFSGTLRTWRKARRLSQLDLAGEADVSARHISFLESGRAQPSREMITRLSDALTLPLDARNQMLTHAGFAARYPGRAWNDADMAPVRGAIDHMLSTHDPYPALALDRLWTVLDMNDGAAHLYGLMGVGRGDSLLDLLRSPDLPNQIENWPQVAYHTCQRLRTESAAQGGVAALDATADHLSQCAAHDTLMRSPVVPTILRVGEARLSLFATIAQFGTPEDVALEEMRVELFFPADEVSAALLRGLVA